MQDDKRHGRKIGAKAMRANMPNNRVGAPASLGIFQYSFPRNASNGPHNLPELL